MQPPAPSPGAGPFKPIAVGFVLLSLPLWLSVFLATDATGRVTNLIAAATMCGLALLLRRTR